MGKSEKHAVGEGELERKEDRARCWVSGLPRSGRSDDHFVVTADNTGYGVVCSSAGPTFRTRPSACAACPAYRFTSLLGAPPRDTSPMTLRETCLAPAGASVSRCHGSVHLGVMAHLGIMGSASCSEVDGLAGMDQVVVTVKGLVVPRLMAQVGWNVAEHVMPRIGGDCGSRG